MDRQQAARECAEAVDKVINQMDGGATKPNAADVLIANVAIYVADREGVTPDEIARHRTT